MSLPSDRPSSSRRDFLKNTTVTAAGAALMGSIAHRAYAQNNGTLRMALIGCGGRGSGACDQALNTNKAGPVKLVAVADVFPDRLNDSLNNLRKTHPDHVEVDDGSKHVGFEAYKQVLDRNDIDVVILGTPPGFRPAHFEYAVSKGKHVFMEKPVAVDATGVRRVLAAAEEAKKKNLKVGVGLQRHHDARYQEIVKRVQDGEIGEVISFRCYWNGNTPWVRPRQEGQTEMQYQMTNWYFFNWLCGDHIVEQHIHNIDVCNWVMGTHPRLAQGQGGRQVRTGKDHGEIYDHHAVEFVYDDKWNEGSKRMYSQCRHIGNCWNDVSEHVYGTQGYAMLSGAKIYDLKGKQVWSFRGRAENPYQVEHDALFAAIRKDEPFNEAFNGAHSTMTAIMGRMCTYSGKLLRWDDALNSKVEIFPHSADKLTWDSKPPVLPGPDGYYKISQPGETAVI